MKVQITDLTTKRVVAVVPISVRGANYQVQEREYFDEAWRCAVDDGLVDAADRERYGFLLAA